MNLMDALILFLIVSGIINFFGSSKRKAQQKRQSTPSTQAIPRNPNDRNKRNPYTKNTKQKHGRDLNTILIDLQSQFKDLERQASRNVQKKTSYAETVVREDNLKRNDAQILKPQILKTSNQIEIKKLYDDMGDMAEEKISVSDMEDYYEALYGDEEDENLFDYESAMEIEAEWESDEAAKIIEIFEDKETTLDLKTAVIFSEIIDRPVAMRK